MRCQIFMGDYDFIVTAFEEVMDIYQRLSDFPGQFFALILYGAFCQDSLKLEEAREVYVKAHKISYEFDDFNLILMGLMHLALINRYSGNLDEEIRVMKKAAKYLKNVDSLKVVGDYNSNYGYLLASARRHEEALTYFDKSLEIYRKYYEDDTAPNLMQTRCNAACSLIALGRRDEAIEILQDLKDKAIHGKNRVLWAEACGTLSDLYYEMGDCENAYLNLKSKMKVWGDSLFKKHRDSSKKIDKILTMGQRETREQLFFANIALKEKTLELEKSLASLNLLFDVGKKMTLTTDIKQLFTFILEAVSAHMDMDFVKLLMVDEGKRSISCQDLYYDKNNEVIENPSDISFDDKTSVAAYVVREKRDVFIKNVKDEISNYLEVDADSFFEEEAGEYVTGTVIYCQLLSEEKIIGLLSIQSKESSKYSDRDFQVIQSIASYVAISLSNAIKEQIIEEKIQSLEWLSRFDVLTGLENRRSYDTYMSSILEGESFCSSLAIVVLDMNHLKMINDTLGHAEGDAYLREVVAILKEQNNGYRIFRMGGDEFAVVALDRADEDIQSYIAKVKRSCEARTFSSYPLSLAIGYACCDTKGDFAFLYQKAEKEMYRDKARYYEKNKFDRRKP